MNGLDLVGDYYAEEAVKGEETRLTKMCDKSLMIFMLTTQQPQYSFKNL